jgi:hypothetical protein
MSLKMMWTIKLSKIKPMIKALIKNRFQVIKVRYQTIRM